MHRSTPARRNDQRVLRSLGVHARRGYGVYGGGRRGRMRDVAAERARRSKAFSIC
jgi:predicted Rossmann-fold nucleotide-binding protein